MGCRCKYGQVFKTLRKLRNFLITDQSGRSIPIDPRSNQTLARQTKAGVMRWWLTGQYQIQLVQSQLCHQLLKLAIMADKL
ncbi:hypothetical protein MA05_10525 [Comamonas aquatica]|nr:hypothetical protein MA05_10525 [Comamonas aquatica]